MKIFLVSEQGANKEAVKLKAKQLKLKHGEKAKIVLVSICDASTNGSLGKKALYFTDAKSLLKYIMNESSKKETCVIDIELAGKELALELYSLGFQNSIRILGGAEHVLIAGLRYGDGLPYNVRETVNAIADSEKEGMSLEELEKITGFSQSVLQAIVKEGLDIGVFEIEHGGAIKLTSCAKRVFGSCDRKISEL